MCSRWSSVFFSMQTTAYELRISDVSSDLCSSDLIGRGARHWTDRPTKQPILNPAGAELSGRGRRAIILALTACLVMAGFVMACLVAVVLSAPARAQEQVAVPAGPVVVLDVRGAIGPATTGCLRDGFRRWEEDRVGKGGV